MAYQFQPVAGISTPPVPPGGSQYLNSTNLGLAASYNSCLMSVWCETAIPGNTLALTWSCGSGGGVLIQLTSTQLTFTGGEASCYWRFPALPANEFINLIVSCDTTSRARFQAYINGQSLGAPTFVFFVTNSISPGTNWVLQPGNCLGDFYYAATPSFFDLSVPSNLAKIINGTVPVNPGSNGQSITGSTPAVFLHLAPGAPATNYPTNLGAGGGTFTVQFGPVHYGICPVFPAIAPPIDLACGTASASSITAQWQPDPSGAAPDSYTLQWGLSAGGPFTTVTGILTTSYVVSGVAPGTTVYWRVAAVLGTTTSPYTVLTTCSTGGAITALTSAVAVRRWRGLVGINWLGFPLVGDGFAPVVGLSDFNAFEEFGQPMIMTLTTPPLQNDRKRIFVTRFEIDMQVGDGLPNLPEDGGTVLLSVSKDSGMTFGTLMKPRSMGAVGEYRTRLRWLNLGQSRAWVFKLVISDPVRRQIIGAYWTGYEALG